MRKSYLRPGMRPLQILACAEQETDRFLLSAMLKHAGHKVFPTNSGSAFLEALDDIYPASYDLAFLDLELSDMRARDVVLGYRYANAGKPVLPIVAFGSYCPEYCRQDLESIGITEILIKPLSMDDLFYAILNVLSAHVADKPTPLNDNEDRINEESPSDRAPVPPIEVQLQSPIIDQASVRGFLESVDEAHQQEIAEEILARFHASIRTELNGLIKAVDIESPSMVRYHLRNIEDYAKDSGLLRLANRSGTFQIQDPEYWFDDKDSFKAEVTKLVTISTIALSNTLNASLPNGVVEILPGKF